MIEKGIACLYYFLYLHVVCIPYYFMNVSDRTGFKVVHIH